MSEKLQKVLARSGLGSRREMEAVIDAGRVSVDGEKAKLGDRIEEGAEVRVDGRLIDIQKVEDSICRVLAYHKAEGEICSRNDPEGRETVFDRLPRLQHGRWIAVGRLDINTSGLLLFTTDGELANRLMHPSFEVEREYAVRVFGDVNDEVIRNLRHGVELEDGRAAFTSVKRQGGEGINQWYSVTLSEGRNREVRRMWESQGMQVSRLIRVRYGLIPLPKGLPRSGWQEMPLEQVNYLRQLVQLSKEENTVIKVADRVRSSQRIRKSVRKHRSRAQSQAAKRRRLK